MAATNDSQWLAVPALSLLMGISSDVSECREELGSKAFDTCSGAELYLFYSCLKLAQ